MDKHIAQAQALLGDLQGVVDQVRASLQDANSQHATLQPKLAELASVESRLAEKQDALRDVTAKYAALSAAYDALKAKLL